MYLMKQTESSSLDALMSYQKEIEQIADQLCKPVMGDFSFIVTTNSMQESIQKLTMLINFVIDAGRRALLSIEEKNLKLTELDQLKSDFLSTISHELRTPLTLIMGPLEMILSHSASLPEEHRENLKRMQRNALRLYMLVNDVLDFSKLEVNKFVVHEEVIDLNELVHYLVMDAQDLAKERKIDLSFSKCSNLPALWLDRKMIEKILMNLVSNALKFTPEEGGVSVVLEKHEDRVFIKVKDTGIGVAQADIPRLFERFHQINSSSTRAHVGTGIGLAITKQFTELLNGTILVNSELGKGTEFIVDLPIREASSEPKILGTPSEISQISHTDVVKPLDTSMSLLATKQKKLEPKVTGDKPLILIVDDNEDMQLYMISLLEELYDIRLAKDGKSALEAIYKHHPQAVISDVMMPIMDGYQLTEAIKTDPDIKHIPIILVTAKSGGGSIKSSLETGADDYLSKPFMAEELIARTKAAVRSYENHEKLKALNTQISQQANLASIGQLSAGIAHEINNPITFIDNNVKVLKKYISNVKHVLEGYKQCLAQTHNEALSQEVKQLEENEKIDFILADIDDLMNESIEGTKRVSDIVRGLKTFSRVDAGIQNGVNLNECIESTLKLMQHEFKYNCVLTKELSDLPTIQCAESQLKQVIMNLLMNALQAIKKEGTITISTHTVNDQVVMKIKDTGCGIAQENLEKLFNPFFTTKPIGEGMGLGLSISYGIIKQYGGDIVVSSTLGKGTEFQVRFPIEAGANSPVA